MKNLIPKPASVTPADGFFAVTGTTKIAFETSAVEIAHLGALLQDVLEPVAGFRPPLIEGSGAAGDIRLSLTSDTGMGDESYTLTITPDSVTLQATAPAGLFYGIQTLRQLLPLPPAGATGRTEPMALPAGQIRDAPRFEWRGTMLDVARHFFPVHDLKRYIELLAMYKFNRLHLHLTDDQGWRIEIKSWDRLAAYGGSTAVGGGPGGYYTQADYSALVSFAAQHFITIIPEIDMPGHTNAALAAYPGLNCDDTAPALYTGTDVGFSTLCASKELTYEFVADVVRELAALTPGPYIHIGGDEAQATAPEDYIRFVERVQEIVRATGKQMIGWEEIARARLHPTTLAQQWKSGLAAQAVTQGARVIMSPASRAYLDMKCNSDMKLGLDWAGYVDVIQAYDWEPSTQVQGIDEASIIGVESPLWSETLFTLEDVEFMAFPRLLGIAEIGWSARAKRTLEDYLARLAAHGARLDAMGIRYYKSAQVQWS